MRILIEILRIFRFVSIISLLTVATLLFAFSAGWILDRVSVFLKLIRDQFRDGSDR